MCKLLIINNIYSCKILAILRAENKLEDFVGTLAKLLPISWQYENLQFVSFRRYPVYIEIWSFENKMDKKEDCVEIFVNICLFKK